MSDEVRKLSADEFPPLLAEIPEPPKQLYVRGTLPSYEWKWLAVVGSRAASSYGRDACRSLIAGLRGYPVVIVSGLAYGIDAEAHKAAIDAGLPTVSVPGSGLNWDVLYPKANVALARSIIQSGGALLSEFNPDQKAADYTFPQRNRIMVGLTHATLVIEAKERSGSLITARLAADYNRELMVVPGSIFSENSKGTHQFLKLGATPVTESADILKALGIDTEVDSQTVNNQLDLTEEERQVLEILETPTSRDELLGILGLPTSEANVLLSMMEIKGLIKEEMGAIHRTR